MIAKTNYNYVYPSQNTFYWTDAACTQYAKIKSDGSMAIINDPAKNTKVQNAKTVPFLSPESSVTYITMPWLQDIYTLDYLYPSSEDNSCDNGACSTLADGSCLCPVITSESAVYNNLPTRDEVLSSLHVGGFDPAIYSDSTSPYSLVDSSSEVEAYSSGSIGDVSTIFKVIDEFGEPLYLKNSRMNITIGDSYTMRNPVSFINLAKLDVLDGECESLLAYCYPMYLAHLIPFINKLLCFLDEVDAFLKYLMRHPNTPAFVCKKLVQYFGVSNPTPGYVSRVTQAFKNGSFTKNGITFGDNT